MVKIKKDWEEFGTRLTTARKAARLSQADLAAAVQLDRTAITKIEAGDRRVDSMELARLAIALRRPIDWFMNPPAPSVVSRRESRGEADDSQADVLLENAARDITLLFELSVLTPPEPFRPTIPVATVETAENAAREIRQHLGLGFESLWQIQSIGEQLGLYAFSIDLENASLDGSYIATEKCGVAVVNGKTPTGRRRFTFAHELGHHILADKYSDEWILGISGSEHERLINAFAVHFLMPSVTIKKRWQALDGDKDPRHAALALGAEFGVSWSAVCAHLDNLGIIDAGKYQQLERERPRKSDYIEKGIHVREDLVPPAVPPLFAAAVIRAYRRHKLSAVRTIELLRGTIIEDDLPPGDIVPVDSMARELNLD